MRTRMRTKKMMLIGLLGFCGLAGAQTFSVGQAEVTTAGAKSQADAAKLEADEAKMRAELEKARQDLDKAAQRVAELSTQLAHNEGRDVFFVNTTGPRRALLGVQIDPASGRDGARVLSVSPGGAAAEAGLL